MMLRPLNRQVAEEADGATEGDDILAGEVVIIDFGLASQSSHEEDRAVDLYVLERAFGSTHPSVEHIFDEEFTPAYAKAYKAATAVLKRLDDVRLRGRKKSMLG
jgi:TP53 regulating kinase-like protein